MKQVELQSRDMINPSMHWCHLLSPQVWRTVTRGIKMTDEDGNVQNITLDLNLHEGQTQQQQHHESHHHSHHHSRTHRSTHRSRKETRKKR